MLFFAEKRRNYAPNDFDRRVNYAQSFTYELPIGPGHAFLNTGFASHAIGGFTISGIVNLVTGLPFTVSANGASLNTPGETQTANFNGSYKVPHCIGNGNQYFDPSSFTQPAGCPLPVGSPCTSINGTVTGNLGRNSFYGPGLVQDNLSIFKTYTVLEKYTLDVRADILQISNTPQFANPNSSLTSTQFGQVTSVVASGTGANGIGGGRSMQIAAVFKF